MKQSVVLLSLFTSGAWACTPGQNFDVYFARNSAVLTASEVSRLGNWWVDTKIKYPHHDFLQIAGVAHASENHPKTLARTRADSVHHYFQRVTYAQAPVVVESYVRPARYTTKENLYRTEIMLAPLPPHDCDA